MSFNLDLRLDEPPKTSVVPSCDTNDKKKSFASKFYPLLEYKREGTLSKRDIQRTIGQIIYRDFFQEKLLIESIYNSPELIYSNIEPLKRLVDLKILSIDQLLKLIDHVLTIEIQKPPIKRRKLDSQPFNNGPSLLTSFSRIIIEHCHEITENNLQVVYDLFCHDKKFEHSFSQHPTNYLNFIQTLFYLNPHTSINILLNSPKAILRKLILINHSINQHLLDHLKVKENFDYILECTPNCEILEKLKTKSASHVYESIKRSSPDSEKVFELLAEFIENNQIPLSKFEPILSEIEFLKLTQHLHLLNFIGFKNHQLASQIIQTCPNRFALIIGDEASLEGLTVIENCNFLNCMSSRVKTLPKLPNCIEINCTGCDELEELPDLPSCQMLNCSYCKSLHKVPSAQNYRIFIANGCSSLTDLPDLPLCVKLQCKDCNALQCIRTLPICEEIDCRYSKNITNIAEQPECKVLEADYCNELQAINQLPECITFSAAECKIEKLPLLSNCLTVNIKNNQYLKKIHFLNSCKYLDCSDCVQLEDIDFVPSCRTLIAYNCYRLLNIRGLDNCRRLDVEWCLSLVQLPNISKIKALNCQNCIVLKEIPPIPQCEILNIANTINLRSEIRLGSTSGKDSDIVKHSILSIPSDFPTRYPVRTLSLLAPHLIGSKQFPIVNILPNIEALWENKFLFINQSGLTSQTRDVGGVGVQLIALICEHLFNNQESSEFLQKNSEGLPQLRSHKNNKIELDCYRVIGHILAMCCSPFSIYAKTTMKTGPLFDEFFYKLLLRFPWGKKPDQNFYVKLLLEIKGLPDTIFESLLNDQDCNEYDQLYLNELRSIYSEPRLDNWKYQVFNNLYCEATTDLRVQALYQIAQGMQEGLGNESLWIEMADLFPHEVKERVEGIFSRQLVLKNIVWDRNNVNLKLFEDTKRYFKEWLDQLSDIDIKRFLSAVTGKISMDGHSIKLHFLRGNKRSLPKSNTCVSTLHLFPYNEQKAFNHDMEWFLEAGSSLENP